MGLRRGVWGVMRLARGVRQARRAIRRMRPQALFTTGGYAAIPPALAAALHRVPILV
ncbi:MAG: hypothetical protein C4312_05825, partial [Thermoflexus sp.]